MAGNRPNPVILYRIVHIENVEYLLRHGLCTVRHPHADPHFINIGDSTLIQQRKEYTVKINPPGGHLGDYITFYFGPLSPMLLNIKTGRRGVTQRPQSDIAYICCLMDDLMDLCSDWCFTDGHAKATRFTEFYNDLSYLDEVDWDLVAARYWSDSDDDHDRMRRKQAEFLVKYHVPVTCINRIVVYDAQKRNFVQQLVARLERDMPVEVNRDYYYY